MVWKYVVGLMTDTWWRGNLYINRVLNRDSNATCLNLANPNASEQQRKTRLQRWLLHTKLPQRGESPHVGILPYELNLAFGIYP